MAFCAYCGKEIPAGQAVAVGGAAGITLCADCGAATHGAPGAAVEEPNLLGAVAAGLAAGLLGALLWYGFVVWTQREWGLIAVAVGWVVAQGVVIGAGRRKATVLRLVSVPITLAAMILGQYLILHHFLAAALGSRGSELPLLLPLDLIAEIVVDYVRDDPMTLFFWAIALWEAAVLPVPKKVKAAPSPTGPEGAGDGGLKPIS